MIRFLALASLGASQRIPQKIEHGVSHFQNLLFPEISEIVKFIKYAN